MPACCCGEGAPGTGLAPEDCGGGNMKGGIIRLAMGMSAGGPPAGAPGMGGNGTAGGIMPRDIIISAAAEFSASPLCDGAAPG